jgi:hypothetical protein
MTDAGKIAERAAINLFYAKSELCQMSDSSALARALIHIDIEEALKELGAVKRSADRNPRKRNKAA